MSVPAPIPAEPGADSPDKLLKRYTFHLTQRGDEMRHFERWEGKNAALISMALAAGFLPWPMRATFTHVKGCTLVLGGTRYTSGAEGVWCPSVQPISLADITPGAELIGELLMEDPS